MDHTDISTVAAERFGIPAVSPYQRLVMTNTLEAARRRPAGSAEARPGGRKDGISWAFDELPAISTANGTELSDSVKAQIVILPTGAGKSLCFQLPALLLPGVTVIVYPLRALISDQERRLSAAGIDFVSLVGGQSREQRERSAVALRSGTAQVCLTNPEAALTRGGRRLLASVNVAHFVVDEAHCISQWGATFRPAYTRLGELRNALSPAATTAFTATASAEVLDDIRQQLFHGDATHLIRGNPDRPNIYYDVVPCYSRAATLAALLRRPQRPAAYSSAATATGRGATGRDVAQEPAAVRIGAVKDAVAERAFPLPPPIRRPAVVFMPTRGLCERHSRLLRRRLGDSSIRFYHAGLTREEKSEVESWFHASADGVLLATCAYGMGVDKKDIRTVVHWRLPESVESYLQESGRAGRDGATSTAIALTAAREEQGLAAWARNYAVARECRRVHLLRHLQHESEMCFGCDVCDSRVRQAPAEQELFRRFLRRHARRFTLEEAAAFLAGELTAAGYRARWERWALFGALAAYGRSGVEAAFNGAARGGALRIPPHGLWRGRVC